MSNVLATSPKLPDEAALLEDRLADLMASAEVRVDVVQRNAALESLLRRAEPALWLLATSGNADAVRLHADCRDALSD